MRTFRWKREGVLGVCWSVGVGRWRGWVLMYHFRRHWTVYRHFTLGRAFKLALSCTHSHSNSHSHTHTHTRAHTFAHTQRILLIFFLPNLLFTLTHIFLTPQEKPELNHSFLQLIQDFHSVAKMYGKIIILERFTRSLSFSLFLSFSFSHYKLCKSFLI